LALKLWDRKDVILKNKAEKLLITKVWPLETKRNKPENKAEKLLKIRTCGKNKAKNKPGHVVENKLALKKQTGNQPDTELTFLPGRKARRRLF